MNLTELETMVREKNMDAPFLARKIGAPAVPKLTEFLTNIDSEIRLIAVNSLCSVEDPSVIPVLAYVLDDEYMPIRLSALNTLWVRHNAVILPSLYESIKSNPYPEIHSVIPLIIGLIGQTSSLEVLEERLEEEVDEKTCANIVLAMARLGDKMQQNSIAKRLDAPEADRRLQAIRDIAYVNDRTIGRCLEPLLEDRRTAYRVGSSAHFQYARICDAVINAASEIYGRPFSFEVSSQSIYTDDQIREVTNFFKKMSK